jgi:hypothetical protein
MCSSALLSYLGGNSVIFSRVSPENTVSVHVPLNKGEPGSSVSVVSDYGLDGRGLIPDRGRGFFL